MEIMKGEGRHLNGVKELDTGRWSSSGEMDRQDSMHRGGTWMRLAQDPGEWHF